MANDMFPPADMSEINSFNSSPPILVMSPFCNTFFAIPRCPSTARPLDHTYPYLSKYRQCLVPTATFIIFDCIKIFLGSFITLLLLLLIFVCCFLLVLSFGFRMLLLHICIKSFFPQP